MRRLLLPLTGVAAGASLVPGLRAIPGALAGAGIGAIAASRTEMRRATGVVRAAEESLPAALDLLGACTAAGMSLEGALRAVAPEVSGPLGQALRAGIAALDVGLPRAEAYEVIARSAGGEETARVCRALARADRFGAAIVETLDAHAEELRARALARAEGEARAAAVRLVFPLALCFLPAFVLLAVAPAVLSAIEAVRGA